jgi:hypothetical protein
VTGISNAPDQLPGLKPVRIPRSILPVPQAIGEPAYVVASATGFVALLLGLFAGAPMFQSFGPGAFFIHLHSPFLDPFILQGLAAAHCIACLEIWRRSTGNAGRPLHWSVPLLGLAALIIAYYGLNDLVFKASFDRPRPPAMEQVAVGWINSRWGASEGGAPSGFASRGVFFLLTCIGASLATERGRSPFLFRFWPSAAIQSALLLSVSFIRVLTGFHYWFDVLLGLALAVPMYWLLVLLVGRFSGFSASGDSLLLPVTFGLIIAFAIVGFAYSGDAASWTWTVLGSLLAGVWILRHRPELRHS